MRLQARRRGPAAAFARKSPAVRVPLRWSIGSRAPHAAHRRRTRTTARPQTLLETPIDANTRLAARMGDIPTDEGRSFLVVVIGLPSRQWAAWSLRADMMCDIAIDARRVVRLKRRLCKRAGLIVHSDRNDMLNPIGAARVIEDRTVAWATLCDRPPRRRRNHCPAVARVQPVSNTPRPGGHQPMMQFGNTWLAARSEQVDSLPPS